MNKLRIIIVGAGGYDLGRWGLRATLSLLAIWLAVELARAAERRLRRRERPGRARTQGWWHEPPAIRPFDWRRP
jgi:hypothetical protein